MKKIIYPLILLAIIGCALKDSFAEDWSDEFFEEEDTQADDIEAETIMGKILLSGEFLDGDILKVSVLAEEIKAPTLGISFHLKYENSKLAFLKYEPGGFLEKGGDPFYLVSDDNKNGKILFGETLRRGDSFPLGSANIAVLYFQILEDASFKFEFEKGIVSSLDTVRQDIDKIFWENATLSRSNKEVNNLSANISSPIQSGNIFVTIIFSVMATFLTIFAFLTIRKRFKFRPKLYS